MILDPDTLMISRSDPIVLTRHSPSRPHVPVEAGSPLHGNNAISMATSNDDMSPLLRLILVLFHLPSHCKLDFSSTNTHGML